MAPVRDRVRIPLLGFFAIALLSLAFVVGAFDALVTNHFSSWNRLTLRPTEDLARAIEGLLPAARTATMVGAAAFGYTSLRRASEEGFRRGAIRLGVVTFSPIIVELADMGTQDGQVPDLDKLPIHSMLLLAALSVGPGLTALWDARIIRSRRLLSDVD